ncbi:hypothetical protein UFOVP1157_39 [uncultured Caudovirales phage]|uniref:Uncharacterized protein n=1 Tax=uncultured Caudovirales phage TaxID=2100421 RepID=A0A6J5QTG1_9CAUD|nr:hypothetical protein UFOVP497_56 [uncultured Caudovirales phage]CAB4164455.1 hypothetical protein UFOVP834_32 [uncultured Caudovirales phage]CAB4172382.1 hypothetical protein UFOVP922_39 [uncultured Caudovirales phage]CAB4177679.1 hypothetical protein UFOVP1006_32 [uncultured Caudovirales phage]CAB4184178.1 hypothetical protein UFOVP1096_48 [uncultured Caudovirales phage]
MPIPIGLRHCVEHEARRGLGWEDCVVNLKVPSALKLEVRQIVLEMSNEHQRQSESGTARSLPELRR